MISCLNPNCRQPQNPDDATTCGSCGAAIVSLLRGRYRVLQPIGQGGFGRTYLAVDEDRLKTRCVIKQFSPQFQGAKSLDKAIQLFDQEAMRLHELGEHPQIPALLAYFEHDSRLYLVQQFIEGPNLVQELQRQGAFSEHKIRELFNDLLPVLKYIHERQVIHRDITPGNIIRRGNDGKLVLIDFGVSKQLTGTSMAQAGTRIGTEGYAPMEQMRSGRAYPASDLYSLAATSIHLLTQVRPDELYDPLQGRWMWREHLTRRGVTISDRLGQVLDKLLKDLVGDRYQSADEVIKELQGESSVAGTPTTQGVATPPPVSPPPVPPPPLSASRPPASQPPASRPP
ncbi:MAG: serine/threonine-protein kinase, partial [Leptolyngbyaceae bacterium]|nr:serine/threonine-protein kinase [Leptolyngbyaceae bacterium]